MFWLGRSNVFCINCECTGHPYHTECTCIVLYQIPSLLKTGYNLIHFFMLPLWTTWLVVWEASYSSRNLCFIYRDSQGTLFQWYCAIHSKAGPQSLFPQVPLPWLTAATDTKCHCQRNGTHCWFKQAGQLEQSDWNHHHLRRPPQQNSASHPPRGQASAMPGRNQKPKQEKVKAEKGGGTYSVLRGKQGEWGHIQWARSKCQRTRELRKKRTEQMELQGQKQGGRDANEILKIKKSTARAMTSFTFPHRSTKSKASWGLTTHMSLGKGGGLWESWSPSLCSNSEAMSSLSGPDGYLGKYFGRSNPKKYYNYCPKFSAVLLRIKTINTESLRRTDAGREQLCMVLEIQWGQSCLAKVPWPSNSQGDSQLRAHPEEMQKCSPSATLPRPCFVLQPDASR